MNYFMSIVTATLVLLIIYTTIHIFEIDNIVKRFEQLEKKCKGIK